MLIETLFSIVVLTPDAAGVAGHLPPPERATSAWRSLRIEAPHVAALGPPGGSGLSEELTSDGLTVDEDTSAQDSQKPPKAKKAKKKKADTVAPDEIPDPDQPTDTGSGGRHFVWKQHPSIRAGSVFRLDFQAKFQEDAHSSYSGAQGLLCANATLPTTCAFELHRSRIGVEGYFFKRIEFEAERELREQELTDRDLLLGYTPKSPWKDVDVNISYINNFQVRVGRFKIPFGLDELTGDSHNDFAYRSLGANALTPSRDIGAMAHGRFFKKRLNYWAGYFRHDGDNARSKKIVGGDDTFAGRITGRPFQNLAGLGGLEVGGAFATTEVADDTNRPNGLRGRTVLTQDTFFDAVFVKGHRRRYEGDVDWTGGPASFRAEVTWVTDQRLQQGLGSGTPPDARARSWYLAGTWILTGEPKTRPVKAANEFLQGGFGALEVVARAERLWFDSPQVGSSAPSRTPRADNILVSGNRAVTIGLNWTLNRWVKLQINGIREQVEDRQRNPIANGGAFWSKVARLQFVL